MSRRNRLELLNVPVSRPNSRKAEHYASEEAYQQFSSSGPHYERSYQVRDLSMNGTGESQEFNTSEQYPRRGSGYVVNEGDQRYIVSERSASRRGSSFHPGDLQEEYVTERRQSSHNPSTTQVHQEYIVSERSASGLNKSFGDVGIEILPEKSQRSSGYAVTDGEQRYIVSERSTSHRGSGYHPADLQEEYISERRQSSNHPSTTHVRQEYTVAERSKAGMNKSFDSGSVGSDRRQITQYPKDTRQELQYAERSSLKHTGGYANTGRQVAYPPTLSKRYLTGEIHQQQATPEKSDEKTAFVVDEVSNIIKESIEGAIGGNAYQHNKVNQWTSNVVEQCLNQLTKLGKPFKYIVTCVIMQKNGAGLHTASSCFWDNTTDGSCTVRWENKTMYCIVSVFGLTI